jgi:Lon protease-like protein
VELPLFPLNTVLFPGGELKLRIFEPRYLTMVSRCMRAQAPFGVVAIKHGSEVGIAETYLVGTLAEIVDFRQEPDGLLGLTVAGRGTFAVERIQRAADGLYLGEVRLDPAAAPAALPPRHAKLGELLRKLFERTGTAASIQGAYDDAHWIGYRLAELLPLPVELRQKLLETTDADARLATIESLLQAQSERD